MKNEIKLDPTVENSLWMTLSNCSLFISELFTEFFNFELLNLQPLNASVLRRYI